MVVGIGFLLLVSLVVSALLAAMSTFLSNHFAILAGVVSIIDFVVSFIGMTAVFALLFKYVPAAQVKWKDAWIGATVTSFLFAIGKLLIGLYLGNGDIGSTFGAARSVVVIMLWAYYSSQIILFGAEFSRLYAERFGSDIIPDANALRVVTRIIKATPARIPRAHRHESGRKE
jgi:membrane protein